MQSGPVYKRHYIIVNTNSSQFLDRIDPYVIKLASVSTQKKAQKEATADKALPSLLNRAKIPLNMLHSMKNKLMR